MFEVLDAQNPWWRGKEKFEEDEDYRRWQSRGKRWVPALVDRLKLEPSSLYFLFGPRQVGKTTTVKFLVKRLLEEGVEPERIFYFRCDRVSDYKELDEVLSTYLRLRETRGIKGCFLFLDEITMPREWFRTIKFLIDTGKLEGDTLLLTGSMGMRARRETESFPGRRGKGRDLFLFPLSFRSFLKVADPELFEKLPTLAELEAEEIKKKCSLCLPLLDRLNSLFEVYTKCGGFPLSVQSFLKEGRIATEVFDAYLSWVKNDITRAGGSVEFAREFVKAILTKSPSPLSWEALAKEAGVRSPKTAAHYVYLLNSLFIALILYHLDPHTGTVDFAKNKKIHFFDPFLYHLFKEWCLVGPEEPDSAIVEATVASHLARLTPEPGGDLFYWRDSEEVDILLRSRMLGFEVKWGRAEGRRGAHGKMKHIIVLSRDQFKESPPVLPVSSFLAVLGVD